MRAGKVVFRQALLAMNNNHKTAVLVSAADDLNKQAIKISETGGSR